MDSSFTCSFQELSASQKGIFLKATFVSKKYDSLIMWLLYVITVCACPGEQLHVKQKLGLGEI